MSSELYRRTEFGYISASLLASAASCSRQRRGLRRGAPVSAPRCRRPSLRPVERVDAELVELLHLGRPRTGAHNRRGSASTCRLRAARSGRRASLSRSSWRAPTCRARGSRPGCRRRRRRTGRRSGGACSDRPRRTPCSDICRRRRGSSPLAPPRSGRARPRPAPRIDGFREALLRLARVFASNRPSRSAGVRVRWLSALTSPFGAMVSPLAVSLALVASRRKRRHLHIGIGQHHDRLFAGAPALDAPSEPPSEELPKNRLDVLMLKPSAAARSRSSPNASPATP